MSNNDEGTNNAISALAYSAHHASSKREKIQACISLAKYVPHPHAVSALSYTAHHDSDEDIKLAALRALSGSAA